MAKLLDRLATPPAATPAAANGPLLLSADADGERPTPVALSVEDRWNAALGCKTSEVALTLLEQLVRHEHPSMEKISEKQIDKMLATATAMLAELQPAMATEALLA